MKRWLFVILIATLCSSAAVAQAQQADAASNAGERVDEPSAASGRMGLSQGVDRLLIEVYKRQRELSEAERDVARREAAVAELEDMIERRIARLEADRQKIEERIAGWETQNGDRIKKLSKVYAAMPANKAARLLSDLELDLAVSVLSAMKQKSSAQVLSAIPPARALVMSKRMARPLAASPDRGAKTGNEK